MQGNIREMVGGCLGHRYLHTIAIAVLPCFARSIKIRVQGPACGRDRDVLDDGGADTADDLGDGLAHHGADKLLGLSSGNEGPRVVGDLDVGVYFQSNRHRIAPDVNAVILVGVDRLRAVSKGGVVEQDFLAVGSLGIDTELPQPEADFQTAIHIVSVFNH